MVFLLFILILFSGETYNGHLQGCDTWMNLSLKEVICTSSDGESFKRMPEVYIRGNTVKYLRVPDEIIDLVKEDQFAKMKARKESQQGGNRNRGKPTRGRGGGRQQRRKQDD
jgi:U6 snRNA-associated Sm-like protein LSm4